MVLKYMNSWKKKEAQDKKDFGGNLRRGSGNFWSRPGDLINDIFLVESKQTDKASYSLNKKTLDKLYENALFSYRIPILSLLLQDVEFVVLWKGDFLKLLKKDT